MRMIRRDAPKYSQTIDNSDIIFEVISFSTSWENNCEYCGEHNQKSVECYIRHSDTLIDREHLNVCQKCLSNYIVYAVKNLVLDGETDFKKIKDFILTSGQY